MIMANLDAILLTAAGFLAGFIDAIVGGGGLISLPSLLALGFPPTLAIGTNKAIGVSAATASSLRYASAGKVDFRGIFGMCVAAFLLSSLGALAAMHVPPDFLRPLTFALLLAVAAYVFTKKDWSHVDTQARLKGYGWRILVAGAIGFYDGFFGPGTGTFLMVAFLLLFGKKPIEASANSRVINYCSNLGAILLFASRGNIDFRAVYPAAIAAFAGSLLGASMSLKIGVRIIRPVFRLVVVALIVKIGYDLLR